MTRFGGRKVASCGETCKLNEFVGHKIIGAVEKPHHKRQFKKKLRAESLRPGRFGFLTEPGHPRKSVAARI